MAIDSIYPKSGKKRNLSRPGRFVAVDNYQILL